MTNNVQSLSIDCKSLCIGWRAWQSRLWRLLSIARREKAHGAEMDSIKYCYLCAWKSHCSSQNVGYCSNHCNSCYYVLETFSSWVIDIYFVFFCTLPFVLTHSTSCFKGELYHENYEAWYWLSLCRAQWCLLQQWALWGPRRSTVPEVSVPAEDFNWGISGSEPCLTAWEVGELSTSSSAKSQLVF